MRRILGTFLLVSLIASQVSLGTAAYFTDFEQSTGNTFQAWMPVQWVQTTQEEFNLGVLNNVDTATSSGDVLLSLVANPTLVTSNNNEVSTRSQSWVLVKTLTFTKDGASYDELRIDSNLRRESGGGSATAYSSIRVDDVELFTHSNISVFYESYSDVLDFSSYLDGEHTIKLYLRTSTSMKGAYSSVFELYRTKTYASSGTIASQVLDTGMAGATWNFLSWDETLQSNTDITFEVRASDTSFLKDDATPTWIAVGGTSPVTSGLPSGRYMQWQATLTTSDSAKTPTLHEVIVEYQ